MNERIGERIGGHKVIQRPLEHGSDHQTPKRIIVHAMAYRIRMKDEVMFAASFLDHIGLSAHMLIAPHGTPIRCRDDEQGAWHAKGYNTDSLGVEVLVPGEHNYSTFVEAIESPWVGPEQYEATVAVVAHWCKKWGIGTEPGSLDRHSDVDPDRKVDPGRGFPWDRFVRDVERMR